MTQQGLWQKLIKKHATKACNGAPAADLAELAKTIKEKHPGRVPTIAVDVLPLLHVFVHTIKVAAVQHAGWSVARELFTLLTIWYNNKGFRLAGWRVLFSLDGLSPPAKNEVARVERERSVGEAKKAAFKIIERGEADEDQVKRLWGKLKQTAVVNADAVASFLVWVGEQDPEWVQARGSVFESDHQMAYFDANNICDAVGSNDGDVVLLGCRVVLCDLHRITVAHSAMFTAGSVHDKEMKKALKTWDIFSRADLACLNGNDYVHRLRGNTLNKAMGLAKSLRGASQRERAAALAAIEQGSSWPPKVLQNSPEGAAYRAAYRKGGMEKNAGNPIRTRAQGVYVPCCGQVRPHPQRGVLA
jgi:hypothetical protein